MWPSAAAACCAVLTLTSASLRSAADWTAERYARQRLLRTQIYDRHAQRHGVEGSVVNHYWRGNHGIWTPWIVRWATALTIQPQILINKDMY